VSPVNETPPVRFGSSPIAEPIPAPQTGNVGAVEAAPVAQVTGLPPNYIVRHWRGDLSLPVSYWVNGLLVTIAVVATFSAVAKFHVHEFFGGRFVGLVMLLAVATAFALSIWQATGIWRSARKHVSRGGRGGWAVAAQIAVVLGVIRVAGQSIQQIPTYQEGFRLLLGIDPTPRAAFRVFENGKEVEVTGGMPYGTAAALETLLDTTPTIRVVQLNSVGGFLSEGEQIGQLIDKRGLTTLTTRRCVSACVLAFLGGSERWLGTNAQLGFHQASVAGVGGQVADHGTARFRQDMLDRGVTNSFIDRAVLAPASGMWYPTARELLDAHVITAVVE
jgi:hypothetical protein